MKRVYRRLLAAATLAGAAFAVSAQAEPTSPPRTTTSSQSGTFGLGGDDNNKPIHIEAENGVEWQQNNRVYIARGNAKATRGQTSVTADTLYAYYRTSPPGGPSGAGGQAQKSDAGDGSNQIYRIEADGNVVFATPTQNAYGDHAVYDMDQTVLVLTGQHLKIVTPQDIVTARDSLEWYDQKQLGVARGDAVAERQGPTHKTIRGDVLVAEITKPANQPSKISKIDARGHVILTSLDEIAHGDSAVYNLDTGIATLAGQVSLTKGDNELRGQYGVVDTNTNVARLLSAPAGAQPSRVEGLFVPPPHDQSGGSKPPSDPSKP